MYYELHLCELAIAYLYYSCIGEYCCLNSFWFVHEPTDFISVNFVLICFYQVFMAILCFLQDCCIMWCILSYLKLISSRAVAWIFIGFHQSSIVWLMRSFWLTLFCFNIFKELCRICRLWFYGNTMFLIYVISMY